MTGPAHVRVSIGTDRYRTQIHAGTHALVADEPTDAGGQDLGPDPYALLMAALGACKAITVRMVADRKGWPLEGVHIDLAHHRRHAEDCDDCPQATRSQPMVSIFECRLTLLGPLTDEQRARLLEVADKCPVHRTLTSANHVRTTLADAPEAPGTSL
ncbi:MAG: hypothetical protein KatS3mg103_0439 [Phycisphaerales bacterium]|nr:MAG: hypothetical protein KatS3mg103_0439 [Phycisphaerales bacterium]